MPAPYDPPTDPVDRESPELDELVPDEPTHPYDIKRAITAIVDGLVEDGLVKREVDKTDRRSVVITATEKGVRIMHEGRSRREKRLLELLHGLSKQDVELLDRASEIIAAFLRTDH